MNKADILENLYRVKSNFNDFDFSRAFFNLKFIIEKIEEDIKESEFIKNNDESPDKCKCSVSAEIALARSQRGTDFVVRRCVTCGKIT